MPNWRPTHVTTTMGDPELDAAGMFEAFTGGERWNGWSTLYFAYEQGQRISARTGLLRQQFDPDSVDTVHRDPDREGFLIKSGTFPHASLDTIPDEDIIAGVYHEGLDETLYPISAWRWTWKEVPAL